MEKEPQTKCPNCGFPLDVNKILYKQLEDELRQKFNSQLSEEMVKYEAKARELKKQREDLENEKKAVEEKIAAELRKKLKAEKEALEAKIKKQIEEEESEKFSVLQKELNEKSEKLRELNKTKAEVESLKREKNELKEAIEAEAQKTLNEKLEEARKKIREDEASKTELQIRELEKKLADQVKLTEEMRRRQEQGSMQLQGEVQELAIEEWLKASFPLDTIEEIKKGQRGADCLQTINTQSRQDCGKIYYESKRAKEWKNEWLEKFKADMIARGTNAGIIVTEVMPSGMDRMGVRDGVWICSYEEFKGLSALMRESVIRISEIADSRENKGEKMTMLYDYLTGHEFRSRIEAIVEGFTKIKSGIAKERRAMEKLWKEREAQVDKVLLNTSGMYGRIKGIAGAAIGTVNALELGEGSMEEEDEDAAPDADEEKTE